ncbi:hypothetical protein [Comamonas sp. JNW]|uniref:hypothetical protein n=1 Tax=Comamonas sp. JNW TaxID=2170731 RepID=UPI0010576389|nr:hypothetical protein [Comamonas sp. JNW]
MLRNPCPAAEGKPMKKFLPLCALVLPFALTGQAIAGANTAQLNCTGSRAGQAVSLVGAIPASIVDIDLQLSYGAQTLGLASPQAEATERMDFRRGIFKLDVALSGANRLQLQAQPKSIKYKGSMGGGKLKASFVATIQEAPEPFQAALKAAELRCSYAYEI